MIQLYYVIRGNNPNLVSKLHQPAEDRWADLDVNRGSEGCIVDAHHRRVFAELVEDWIDQRPVELQHHVFQFTATHLERLLRELRHAVDLGIGLIGEGGLFYDFQPVDAVAGRSLRVLAAIRHQIIVVFVKD